MLNFKGQWDICANKDFRVRQFQLKYLFQNESFLKMATKLEQQLSLAKAGTRV